MSAVMWGRNRVLALSFTAFTVAFAVWMMLGVLGIPIRKEFGLSDAELGLLLAASAMGGSLPRMLAGVLTDKYGGRAVFTAFLLLTVPGALLVTRAGSYPELVLYALWFGLAGNTFTIGIAWCSAWHPPERQGLALGVFGAGNVGASATKFIGPALIAAVPAGGFLGGAIPGGWRFVPVLYAAMLVAMAALLWFLSPTPDRKPGSARSFLEMHRVLRFVRVWRFGLYYMVVFGAYVALSLWLPKYYVDVFGLPLATAALLTTLFIFPASLLRPVGGWVSDLIGARKVMYFVFGSIALLCLPLSLPGLVASPWLFTLGVVAIGVSMGIGKAAVYRYIPDYFPNDVGAVGGMVGLLGALGGFFLPATFGYLDVATGVPQTTWLVMLLLSGGSLVWLHAVVASMRRAGIPYGFERGPGTSVPSEIPPSRPSPFNQPNPEKPA